MTTPNPEKHRPDVPSSEVTCHLRQIRFWTFPDGAAAYLILRLRLGAAKAFYPCCRPGMIGFLRRSLSWRSQAGRSVRSARCSAGPWVAIRLCAAFTSPTCEKACGKLPSCRFPRGSYSSASSPTSLRRDSRRSKRAAEPADEAASFEAWDVDGDGIILSEEFQTGFHT